MENERRNDQVKRRETRGIGLEESCADLAFMIARAQLMRKAVHKKHASIAVVAFLMAVALPVTVLFSREGEASPEITERPAIVAPVSMFGAAAESDWTADAAQSASMVLVGTLLIGVGSLVRRTV